MINSAVTTVTAAMPEHPLASIALRCIQHLLEQDLELFTLGAHEQAISGRLAGYIQRECALSTVDTEYNRHALLIKKANLPSGRKRVVPDIVVHSRGTDVGNELVIELKVSGRGDDSDRQHAHEKLNAFVHGDEFRYELGLYVELGLEDGAARVIDMAWYVRDQP